MSEYQSFVAIACGTGIYDFQTSVTEHIASEGININRNAEKQQDHE